jgi:hypothetical protein
MLHVTFGTDVYGAVRSVARTPVVTKFWMFNAIPLLPEGSYYMLRLGKKSGSAVPLLGGEQHQGIVGLPCRRISTLSVLITYVRAFAALLLLPSTIILFSFAVMRLTGPARDLDENTKRVFVAGIKVLAAGISLGAFTYLFTLWTPRRERRIRLSCGRVLGVAADPAWLKPEYAREIAEQIRGQLEQSAPAGLDAILRHPRDCDLPALDLWLVQTRTQMTDGRQASVHEATTDRILEAIAIVLNQMKDVVGH